MTPTLYRCRTCGSEWTTSVPAVITCPHGEHSGRRPTVMDKIDETETGDNQ